MTMNKGTLLLSACVVLLLCVQANAYDSICSLTGDPHLIKFGETDGGSDWERKPGVTKLAVWCGNQVEVTTNACNYNGVAVACTNTTTVAGGCDTDKILSVKDGDTLMYSNHGVVTTVPTLAIGATFQASACLSVTRNGYGDYTFTTSQGTVHINSWSIPAYLGGPAGPYENVYVDVNDSTCALSGACGTGQGPAPIGGVRRSAALTADQHWASWAVLSFCDSLFPWNSRADYTTATTVNSSIVYPSSPVTTTDATLQAKATAACAPLAPGSSLATQCAGTIGAAASYQDCLDDVILSKLVNFASDAINGFAFQCAKQSATHIVLLTAGAFSNAAGAGLGTNIPQYSTVSFMIYSRDVLGNLVTTGGDVYVITSTGPSALTFKIVDNKDGTYTVTYTVNVVGTYTLEIRLNGVDSVRGAPATVTVVAGACANFLYDGLAATIGDVSPYTLTLAALTPANTDQQWKFVNNYIVSCSSKATYAFDISNQLTTNNAPVGAWVQKTTGYVNNQKWTYNTTAMNFYSYSAANFYLKHVTSGSVNSLVCSYDVPPAIVLIQPPLMVAVTAASKTTASGPGLGVNVPFGAQTFTITARDAQGNRRTTGGDVFSITSSPALAFTIVDNNDGTYSVSYTAAVGMYAINVKFSGSQISGSPYAVSYVSLGTDAAHTIVFGAGVQPTITSGIPLTFYIQAKTASGTNVTVGGDDFVVTFNPALDGETPYGPYDNNNGLYTVQYEQDDVMEFSISVTLNGVNVAGSPFAIESVF